MDLVDADLLVGLLGVSAVLTGLLRVLGGFAAERQFGRRWTIGGLVLGALEIVLGGVLLLNTEVNADILVPVAAGLGIRQRQPASRRRVSATSSRSHLARGCLSGMTR